MEVHPIDSCCDGLQVGEEGETSAEERFNNLKNQGNKWSLEIIISKGLAVVANLVQLCWISSWSFWGWQEVYLYYKVRIWLIDLTTSMFWLTIIHCKGNKDDICVNGPTKNTFVFLYVFVRIGKKQNFHQIKTVKCSNYNMYNLINHPSLFYLAEADKLFE